MFKKSYLLLLVAALYICLSTVAANADTIFSDLPSSGAKYDPASAAGVLGSSVISGGPEIPASQFQAVGTGSLDVTQIDVAVDSRFAPVSSGRFQVQIWASSLPLGAGIPTGTALYTSPIETPIGVYGDVNDLFTISGITGLSLTGGQTYFMSVNAVDSNGDAAWHRNVFPAPPPNATTGLVLQSRGTGTPWTVIGNPTELPAFDILGSAPVTGVPEPCTVLLLGLGLIGLGGLRRKIQ